MTMDVATSVGVAQGRTHVSLASVSANLIVRARTVVTTAAAMSAGTAQDRIRVSLDCASANPIVPARTAVTMDVGRVAVSVSETTRFARSTSVSARGRRAGVPVVH